MCMGFSSVAVGVLLWILAGPLNSMCASRVVTHRVHWIFIIYFSCPVCVHMEVVVVVCQKIRAYTRYGPREGWLDRELVVVEWTRGPSRRRQGSGYCMELLGQRGAQSDTGDTTGWDRTTCRHTPVQFGESRNKNRQINFYLIVVST